MNNNSRASNLRLNEPDAETLSQKKIPPLAQERANDDVVHLKHYKMFEKLQNNFQTKFLFRFISLGFADKRFMKHFLHHKNTW